MTSIPLYDDSVPITCTAGGDEIERRLEQIERLHRALDAVERTEHGALLTFPNTPDLEADLRRFTVDEKGCCRFWGFDIAAEPDALVLRWDAPPELADYMDRLVAYFEGDEPITATSGLL